MAVLMQCSICQFMHDDAQPCQGWVLPEQLGNLTLDDLLGPPAGQPVTLDDLLRLCLRCGAAYMPWEIHVCDVLLAPDTPERDL